jgi:hypothetical protein
MTRAGSTSVGSVVANSGDVYNGWLIHLTPTRQKADDDKQWRESGVEGKSVSGITGDDQKSSAE